MSSRLRCRSESVLSRYFFERQDTLRIGNRRKEIHFERDCSSENDGKVIDHIAIHDNC